PTSTATPVCARTGWNCAECQTSPITSTGTSTIATSMPTARCDGRGSKSAAAPASAAEITPISLTASATARGASISAWSCWRVPGPRRRRMAQHAVPVGNRAPERVDPERGELATGHDPTAQIGRHLRRQPALGAGEDDATVAREAARSQAAAAHQVDVGRQVVVGADAVEEAQERDDLAADRVRRAPVGERARERDGVARV